jgi:putative restriction endonuclease
MRITRRTSGGRGEYEVSEPSASGLRPSDLQHKQLIIDLGQGIVIPTSTTVSMQGGKPRLRILNPTQGSIHLHRQVAAALMMPHPAREDTVLAGGLPIMRSNQYAIEHITLEDAHMLQDRVLLPVAGLTLRNFSYHAEPLDVPARIENLRRLWMHKTSLPQALTELITLHETKVLSGLPLDTFAERVVLDIQDRVTDFSEDLGIAYRTTSEDAMPDLQKALGTSASPPAPPTRVSEIDPNETIIKRRITKEWKRWANSRGSASAVFRQAVRQAYRSTCLVCGLHLPTTSMNASPGVDAAHILPWSDFDLDVVANGLCLCKLHHWAFDEGLIGFFENEGLYRVEMLPGVSEAIAQECPAFDISLLTANCGVIPMSRLPNDQSDWPSPRFLQLLRDSE